MQSGIDLTEEEYQEWRDDLDFYDELEIEEDEDEE